MMSFAGCMLPNHVLVLQGGHRPSGVGDVLRRELMQVPAGKLGQGVQAAALWRYTQGGVRPHQIGLRTTSQMMLFNLKIGFS